MDLVNLNKSDRIIEGMFFEDKIIQNAKSNNAKIIFRNGDVYNGNIKDESIGDYGTMLYIDGSIYQGSFEDEKRHGFGIFITKEGDKYKGIWEDDKKCRFGISYDKEKKEISIREYGKMTRSVDLVYPMIKKRRNIMKAIFQITSMKAWVNCIPPLLKCMRLHLYVGPKIST